MVGRLATGALALAHLVAAPGPAGELSVGYAEAEFDLPEGVSLAGYGGGDRRRWLKRSRRNPYSHRFKPSQGELDPVGSRAIVLDLDGRPVVLVSTDLVAVSAEMKAVLVDRVKDIVSEPERLFLTATHTHSGPAGFARAKIWQYAAADKFVQELFDRYVDSMETAVRQAVERSVPATLAVGGGAIEGVSRNRRDAGNPLDPVATLIRIDSPAGAPIATIVNFPIHPTVLTDENLYLSGDVAGAIVRHLGERTRAPAIFINGAEGDVAPPRSTTRDPAGVEALGREIAGHLFEIWESLWPGRVRRLATTRSVVDVGPVELNLPACFGWNKRSGKWMKKLESPFLSTAAPVAGLRIEDHVFVSIPGELIAELGLAIKALGAEAGFASTSILGLANDHLGYILTEEEYRKGGYEVCASWYGRHLGAKILAGAEDVLRSLDVGLEAGSP